MAHSADDLLRTHIIEMFVRLIGVCCIVWTKYLNDVPFVPIPFRLPPVDC